MLSYIYPLPLSRKFCLSICLSISLSFFLLLPSPLLSLSGAEQRSSNTKYALGVSTSSSGFHRIVGAARNLRRSGVGRGWDHVPAAGDSRGRHEGHRRGAGRLGCSATAQVTRLGVLKMHIMIMTTVIIIYHHYYENVNNTLYYNDY